MYVLSERDEKVNSASSGYAPQNHIQAQLADIGRRYCRKPKHPPGTAALRRRECSRLANYRHGQVCAQRTPAARNLLYAWACHLLPLPNPRKRILGLLQMWAPWMSAAEREQQADAILSRAPRRWSAARLGEFLELTDAERSGCGITTIRSIDGPSSAERKRTRERERRRRLRESMGAILRVEYLANSKERQKPWSTLGISRATYFRRGLHVATPTVELRAAA